MNNSKVYDLRIKNGMTQNELAEKSGIYLRQIQRYDTGENDTGKMMLKNAIALADALGCDVRDLL